MNLKIIFHPHAIDKLKKRNLKQETVEEAIKNPDTVSDGKFGRKIAQKVYARYLLRVIYEERADSITVITAYPTKPERYE